MSFCRTKSVRMQGLLQMAADVDQTRGRSAEFDQFRTKKRMMALSAYTWPSDSKYWPVYLTISVAIVTPPSCPLALGFAPEKLPQFPSAVMRPELDVIDTQAPRVA